MESDDVEANSESELLFNQTPTQGTSRKPFYNYGGLNRIPKQHTTPPSPPSSAFEANLTSFKKLASKLGFGLADSGLPSSPESRMTLGLINVIPDEEQAGPVGFGTAPLTPSRYIRRLSILGPRPQPIQEVTSRSSVDEQWKMNYKEAAIYLEEGNNNEEFCSHPKRTESLPAYLMAHTRWFYLVDFTVSFLLLCLTMIEAPTISTLNVAPTVQASLELTFLYTIGLGVIIKTRWLGLRKTILHHRTLFKIIVLLLMTTEAIVILVRGVTHFRISRCLRPVFILDNRHLRGVRRFARQILQCMPPILDMLVLLFFFIFIFSLLGHFLFGGNRVDPFFRTVEDSFVNLFILLTTANYPDIMMESYYKKPLNVLFFVCYLGVVLYFFTNLLLAVVYDNFTAVEQEKLRKLVLHKRKACQKAYHLLVSKANNHGIIFRHFCGMVMVYKPNKPLRDIYLMFRAMDHSQDGYLNKEEFCRFFEYIEHRWSPLLTVPQKPWKHFKRFGILMVQFLDSKYSDYLFNSLVIINTILMLDRWMSDAREPTWDSCLFAFLFSVELTLKTITWGKLRILSSGWQIYDLLATIAFAFATVFSLFLPKCGEVLFFMRPLRLVRLFKLKKRYRNVLGTLFVLLIPMASASVILVFLYYFFAIIGMEIFSGIDLRNCCNGTLIESYFTTPEDEDTFALRFYLNTFSNVFQSYVTLFELMVVNNWYVIMEGHVRVTSRWSRIYFFLFYLSTMILLNIVVAFILDSFLFRMRYKRTINKSAEDKLLRTEVLLNSDEINFCYHQLFQNEQRRAEILEAYGADLTRAGTITYVGKGKRTKEILFKRVCKSEVSDWIKNSEEMFPKT